MVERQPPAPTTAVEVAAWSPRSIKRRVYAAVKAACPGFWLRALVGIPTHIPTQMSARERLLLYDEARASVRIGRFLEVGSYLGSSAIVLAEALARCPASALKLLYCVDTWNNDAMSDGPLDTWAGFSENVARWSMYIRPLRGHSQSVALPFEGECDLVFIDGDHSYEGCNADVQRFARLVRPGGRMLLHDHVYYAGVTRVVGELLSHGGWYVSRAVDNLISLACEPQWGRTIQRQEERLRSQEPSASLVHVPERAGTRA